MDSELLPALVFGLLFLFIIGSMVHRYLRAGRSWVGSIGQEKEPAARAVEQERRRMLG